MGLCRFAGGGSGNRRGAWQLSASDHRRSRRQIGVRAAEGPTELPLTVRQPGRRRIRLEEAISTISAGEQNPQAVSQIETGRAAAAGPVPLRRQRKQLV